MQNAMHEQAKVSSADKEIVPEVHSWRPFKRDDLDAVKNLENYSSHKSFGTFDVEELTELCGHSIVVLNKINQIMACVCLQNYPNIPSLLPGVWPEVLQNLYKANELTFENTLFVHMLLCDCRYNWDFLLPVLRTLFMCLFKLQYVVIVMPADGEQFFNFSGLMLAKYFVKMLPRNRLHRKSIHVCQTLFVAFRDRILPPLKIRYAVAEDNDDLVEILDNSAPKLKQQYGDFYIAEIVLDPKSTRKMIVAEHDNKVVGMLCLNSMHSRKQLTRIFDLSAFNGLHKLQPGRIIQSISDYSYYSVQPISKRTVANLIPLQEQVLSIVDSDGLTLIQSLTESPMNVQSDGATSTEEFLKLLRQTYNIEYSSNISLDSTSDESMDNDMAIVDSYEKHKHQYLQHNSVHLNQTKSVDIESGFESDVFLIELHCMHKDMDERRALDLILTAFETFPDLSYCLIAFPTQTRVFPLLSFFVNLSTRTMFMSCPRTKIYLLQRNALFSPIVVSLIQPDDESSLKTYLRAMHNGENHLSFVFSAARRFHNEAESDVFPIIVRCLDTIIGVCVLQTYNYLPRLKIHFQIETHIHSKLHSHYNQVGMLQMMILHPAFMNRLPFVRTELFRLTGFTSLFFKLRDTSANADIVVNTMLSEMVPVRPRIRMIYPTEMLQIANHPDPYLMHTHLKKPFALYHQNITLCTKRKVAVTERIVVVGCSSTAMSFLEELLFGKDSQHVWFTSITMISPNGFSAIVFDDISDLAKGYFFMLKYTPEYIRRLGLGAWVDVVFSSVNKIDRQLKNVHINDGRIFPYDRLFLFCGLQFDYPINVKVPEHQPRNVAFLNNAREAELFVLRIKAMQLNSEECNIVVYGDSVHCYSCIDLLLQLQVDSTCITFIRPKAKEKIVGCTSSFNDNFVDDVMDKLLQSSNIKVLDKYDIVDWILDKENTITKINVASDLSVLELQCSLFVCFERKIVMRRTIRVLNEAGLVFDGRLVINSKCETNDPSIFAAGPMTKYRRILYADNCRHQYFSSIEIGARLGRRLFDQLNPGRPVNAKVKLHTVPGTVHMFREPMVQCRPTLDGYRFLCIRKPGPPVPYELMKSSDKYGVDLITVQNQVSDIWGSNDVKYFRCHLNEYNNIATIVCLTRQPINVRLLLALWGQNESVLHNLRHRYEANYIQDLYTHFSEPWTYVLYHDMYRYDLNARNLHVALHHTNNFLNLNEETRDKIIKNKFHKLTEIQRESIILRFVTTSYRDMVEKNLMDFLGKHIDDLPMFALPK